jgi:hypothetical protein
VPGHSEPDCVFHGVRISVLSSSRLSSFILMTCPFHLNIHVYILRYAPRMPCYVAVLLISQAAPATDLKKRSSASSSRVFCCVSVQHSHPCSNVGRLRLSYIKPGDHLAACFCSFLACLTFQPWRRTRQFRRHFGRNSPEHRNIHHIMPVPITLRLRTSQWYMTSTTWYVNTNLLTEIFPYCRLWKFETIILNVNIK